MTLITGPSSGELSDDEWEKRLDERDREKQSFFDLVSAFFPIGEAKKVSPKTGANTSRWSSKFKQHQQDVLSSLEEKKTPVVLSNGQRKFLMSEQEYLEYMFRPFKDENWESTARVFADYFSRHNREYVEKLFNSVNMKNTEKGELVSEKTKCIVVIPARNEPDLMKCMLALKKAYQTDFPQGKFEEEVGVILFHNYKGDKKMISQQIQESVQSVSNIINVHTIEMQMPEGANVGYVKKIATDLAMVHAFQAERNIPVVSIDADTVELSPGIFRKGLSILSDSRVLAASPQYDYDKESQEKFPVWGFRCQAMLLMRQLETHGDSRIRDHRIVGACMFIEPKTLALLGGMNPFNFTDMQLTANAREAMTYWMHYKDPVAGFEDENGVVYVNPSKELKNIMQNDGTLPDAHWSDPKIQQESSGSLRFDWKNLEPNPNIFLLKPVLSNEDKAPVLQDVWESFQKNVSLEQASHRTMLSVHMLRTINELRVDGISIRLKNGVTIKGSEIENYLISSGIKRGDTYLKVEDFSQSENPDIPQFDIESIEYSDAISS